jgi:hypothetical protein
MTAEPSAQQQSSRTALHRSRPGMILALMNSHQAQRNDSWGVE